MDGHDFRQVICLYVRTIQHFLIVQTILAFNLQLSNKTALLSKDIINLLDINEGNLVNTGICAQSISAFQVVKGQETVIDIYDYLNNGIEGQFRYYCITALGKRVETEFYELLHQKKY